MAFSKFRSHRNEQGHCSTDVDISCFKSAFIYFLTSNCNCIFVWWVECLVWPLTIQNLLQRFTCAKELQMKNARFQTCPRSKHSNKPQKCCMGIRGTKMRNLTVETRNWCHEQQNMQGLTNQMMLARIFAVVTKGRKNDLRGTWKRAEKHLELDFLFPLLHWKSCHCFVSSFFLNG